MSSDASGNVGRIARILHAIAVANAPMSTRELRDASGATKSTLHGLLRALCAAGWLERVAHGTYRLGPRAADLAIMPPLPPAPIRMTAPKSALAPAGKPALPQPRLPPLHPDLLEIRKTDRYQRFGAVRIGFANASLANPWRGALVGSLLSQARRHDGRIARLSLHHAADDPARQARQILQMVDDGLDVLIISACDDRELILSDTINQVANAGIPVVAVDRRPMDLTGVVSFVTASDRTIGAMSALWLAEFLGGQGKIWMLSGRKEAPPAIRRLEGARMVLEQFPDLEVGKVEFTDWSEEGGYKAVEKLALDDPTLPAGVWCDSGLHGVGSVRWFLNCHGKVPPHTGGDQNLMYKLCLGHRIPFAAIDYPYSMGEQALSVALDILSGRPVPKRLEVPLAMVMPRGCQTKSVIPDIWAEAHVGWNSPDDEILPRRRPSPKDTRS